MITSQDGTISALLGASPGASTAVHVMLEVIKRCFPEHLDEWEPKIKEMIPSYGQSLVDNRELLDEVRQLSSEVLGLTYKETTKN